MRHPMQPVYVDKAGTPRFQRNAIVDYLFLVGALDLNKIAAMDFDPEDRSQLAQLLGYSIAGYGELPYVSGRSYSQAVRRAQNAKGPTP